MVDNKVSYQTNFSGIKYSNNPLAIDANSFSNANNVYLNKYQALISRPPINAVEYPALAYSATTPTPIELKIVGTYELSNGGIIYVVYHTTNELYTLRYKTPAGAYSNILTSVTIESFSDFHLTQYKQYYILFTTDGTKVLDTTSLTNNWVALSTVVDIPVTSIQTGNEQVTLEGNQFTGSYKKQFILKPDSDDTIYSLPVDETAVVTFPNQTDVTYNLLLANEYTRDRVLRKLNTPVNSDVTGLVSIVGEKIAIAHDDRVDLSLDYGETFETIVYPTNGGVKYKNTASLSDDGQYFFYVHTDGVYRLALGTREWMLIEVTLTYSYVLQAPYESLIIEKGITGISIDNTAQGANYCHFVNAEKFAFMLAHYRTTEQDWIATLYVKGINVTNLFNQNLALDTSLLNSFATNSSGPLYNIGADLTLWAANPYLNKKLTRILDDNTVVYYMKYSSTVAKGLLLKAAPTYIYRGVNMSMASTEINYVAITTHSISIASTALLNELILVVNNVVKLLIKSASSSNYWATYTYAFSVTIDNSGALPAHIVTFTATNTANATMYNIDSTEPSIHMIGNGKYICGNTLWIVDNNYVSDEYVQPLSVIATSKVVASNGYYAVFNEATQAWYTNIPIMTTLTYNYTNNAEFTQIPNASFADQNLWLAMDKTIWVANLIDNKLSALPINNNVFSKPITGISPISITSKAIFFEDSITLCEESALSDGSVVWYYYPLKFAVGVRLGDTILTTNDGKLTLFPTKYGLAALSYQLNVATTEQAITYLTDEIKSLWSDFYVAGSVKILHHNTQLILSNGTNQLLIYDFRTSGWYPLTFPTNVKIKEVKSAATNYESLELQPADSSITTLTGVYQWNKEHDELYTYETPYKDLGTMVIPWHLTSQILLLDAPNHYKNLSQLIIDQVDSSSLKQSAYLTTQIFRQTSNTVKPSIELIYNIDTFGKIVKKVNWWKVLGFKWQLENDANSSYPTQLRLYNVSIKYDISYEVK